MASPVPSRKLPWVSLGVLCAAIELVFVAVGFFLAPGLRVAINLVLSPFVLSPPPAGPTATELRTRDAILGPISTGGFAVIGAIVAVLVILAYVRIETRRDP